MTHMAIIFISSESQNSATQVFKATHIKKKYLFLPPKTIVDFNIVRSKRCLQALQKENVFEEKGKQTNKEYSFFSFLSKNSRNLKSKTKSSFVPNFLSEKETVSHLLPTLNENETMYDYFLEWIYTLLEEMKGKEWLNKPPNERSIGLCSENLNLKHQVIKKQSVSFNRLC
jgi:hypothetical protein